MANTSIAIDRSIAETQLIDRTWFCIELTRYLRTFFIQYFRKLHENEKRCILWHFVLVTLLPTGRSRVIKKFSRRSQSNTSWPPLAYSTETAINASRLIKNLIIARYSQSVKMVVYLRKRSHNRFSHCPVVK